MIYLQSGYRSLWKKPMPQWLHWYGFSQICVLWWTNTIDFWEKLLPQWLHWNMLSDEPKMSGLCKPFGTMIIQKSISAECILWYNTNVDLSKKFLSQWLHLNGFFPLCVLWCIININILSYGTFCVIVM